MKTTYPAYTYPTIYARQETTTDSATRDMFRAQGTPSEPLPFDVQFYYDAEGTQKAGRIPWYANTKPDRRHKWQTLNCYRYRLAWIEATR